MHTLTLLSSYQVRIEAAMIPVEYLHYCGSRFVSARSDMLLSFLGAILYERDIRARPLVTVVVPGDFGTETVENDGVFDVASLGNRLVGSIFQRDFAAAAIEAVASEQHGTLRVLFTPD